MSTSEKDQERLNQQFKRKLIKESNPFLRKLFNELNKKYFNNKLNVDSVREGFCDENTRGEYKRPIPYIRMISEIYVDEDVLKSHTVFEIKAVMLHEMCHILQKEAGNHHGRNFIKPLQKFIKAKDELAIAVKIQAQEQYAQEMSKSQDIQQQLWDRAWDFIIKFGNNDNKKILFQLWKKESDIIQEEILKENHWYDIRDILGECPDYFKLYRSAFNDIWKDIESHKKRGYTINQLKEVSIHSKPQDIQKNKMGKSTL